MRRRHLISLILGGMASPWALRHAWAGNDDKLGILLLHGKNPGSSRDPGMVQLRGVLEAQGWPVLLPDMPWSRSRYLEGNWDGVMAEIARHVQTLRDKGAQRIVLIGHSMGCPAAMSFAARGGAVQAIVLLAPGHIPYGYYNYPSLKPVRESIDEARALVAQGKGDAVQSFADINQGRRINLSATASNYLSFFDPTSDAEMGVTAPRIPADVPVFTAMGESDPLFANIRGYLLDRLPANPKTQYLPVPGGHLDTPRNAADAVLAWLKNQ